MKMSNVFPIEHGDFPASDVILYQGPGIGQSVLRTSGFYKINSWKGLEVDQVIQKSPFFLLETNVVIWLMDKNPAIASLDMVVYSVCPIIYRVLVHPNGGFYLAGFLVDSVHLLGCPRKIVHG